MIGIKAIKLFTPGQQVPTGELPEREQLGETELAYYDNCGIETVYDSGKISSYELAKGACERLLDETGTDPGAIDFILYIQSRMPEHFMSSEATRLQYDIKAAKSLCFSLSNLGCTDSSMALKLAKDLLIANRQANNVLICYGNKLFSNYRFRYPVTIIGDGGVAALVSRTEDNKISDISIESNGSYWDLFKLEYKDKNFDEYREECSDYRKYGFELAIESKNRFEAMNAGILAKNKLEKADIHHFMLQNISGRAYAYYESAFDLKMTPICGMNLSRYGHLGAADILVNYGLGIESGIFQKGEKVLMMNNSPVAAWSSILIDV